MKKVHWPWPLPSFLFGPSWDATAELQVLLLQQYSDYGDEVERPLVCGYYSTVSPSFPSISFLFSHLNMACITCPLAL